MPPGDTMTSRASRDAHNALKQVIQTRYTLLSELAQGELSEVYLARPRGGAGDPARPVVLKCPKPAMTLDAQALASLRHEAWVSSQLHHAHLTRCIELVQTDDSCYVVQNYVEGKNLSQLLLLEDEAAREHYIVPWVVDVLEGLHAMHTALDDQSWPLLLLHGGIRARHVLVGTDGNARLTDFSHAQSRRGLVSSHSGGRPHQARYMAPEQVRDPESVDHRSDLFLVGLMLWEALTGVALFAAPSEELTLQHLLQRPILAPSKVGLRPPKRFDEICLRALQRDRDKRYDSALEMAQALRDAAFPSKSRAEIGEWVRSIGDAERSEDDEPTARFLRSPHSDMRELGSTTSLSTAKRVFRAPRLRAL